MKALFCQALACLISLSLHVDPTARAADPSSHENFRPMAQNQFVPPGAKLELLWNEGEFTEGPTPAADGAILFSDIGNRILRFDPRTKETSVFRGMSGKSNGLKFDPHGNLIACEGAAPGGNRRISLTDRAGNVRTLADRFEGQRFNSPNDLAINTTGRVYFSDPRYVGFEPRELDFEGVFLVEPDGTARIATRDIQKPNGIIVTPDDKMVYLSDNNSLVDGNHQLVAFDVLADGTLGGKRVLYDFGKHQRGIDGMTLDVEGNIYATAGTGTAAGIYVFGPQGQPRAFIATPGDPTNCVFGIGDERATLYVTAAATQPIMANRQPRYALFRIPLRIAGYHVFPPLAKP